MNPRARTHLAWSAALALVAVSVVAMLALFGSDGSGFLDLVEELERRVSRAPLLTALVFVVLFALTTALTLPTATLLCVCAGYLFGTAGGTLVSLIGALGGALMTFVSVRFLARDRVREFFLRGRGERIVSLLERDAFFYLMSLRIVPVAPFFAINAAGAMIRVTLKQFVVATTLGLVPLTAIYASVGASLDVLVEARAVSGPELLLEPRVALPLLALIAVFTAGWLWRRYLRRRRAVRDRDREAAGVEPGTDEIA
ncbi:MAG: VTT domain-containing protein [Wenzhouxiangellaceae bacterium]|nr:VTT domain-containing protein [Wenzhouxiangellaceae bacterium]